MYLEFSGELEVLCNIVKGITFNYPPEIGDHSVNNKIMCERRSDATVPIGEAVQEALKYIEKIICNDITQVLDDLYKRRTRSVYHAMAYAHVMFLRAGLTLHKEDIEKAVAALIETSTFCHGRRKQSSMVYRIILRENYNSYTTEQVHAELCYGTTLLAESILTMLQDPSFLSVVHGAFKFRSCYRAFKECIAILKERSWGENEQKIHFESGVMLGVGVYNLIIASLPQKVLNLLEFIGFHGDEATGERLLMEQVESFEGFMAVLSCCALLIYQTYLYYIFGNGDADFELIHKTVEKLTTRFPQAALGLYFEGRLHQINGRIESAIEKFELANKVMDDYIPFDAFFNWDHTYLYAFAGRWNEADATVAALQEKCSWSNATAIYVRAACTYMRGLSESNNHVVPEEILATVTSAMSEVPSKCRMVAGRTVPIEVFCSMRSRTFLERNRLILPLYELMYLWGHFNMFSKNNDTLMKAYRVVLDEVTRLKPVYDHDATYLPDWCLARFMQGVLLRYLKELDKAEEIFKEVIEQGPVLKEEIHSAAFSSLELGLLLIDRGLLEEAKERIKLTRAYRSFPLSIPVSFKVHSAYKQVKKLLQEHPWDQKGSL